MGAVEYFRKRQHDLRTVLLLLHHCRKNQCNEINVWF